MTSVCEHVRSRARSRVEYFRCEVSKLVHEALTVDLVEDATRVVIPNTQPCRFCIEWRFRIIAYIAGSLYSMQAYNISSYWMHWPVTYKSLIGLCDGIPTVHERDS